jgi:hypothetical protein
LKGINLLYGIVSEVKTKRIVIEASVGKYQGGWMLVIVVVVKTTVWRSEVGLYSWVLAGKAGAVALYRA